MNVASAHPFPNNEPHCSSIPKVAMCLVSLVAIIDDINFAAISPSAMPLHLFGLDKSPVFGRIHRPNLVNASGLYSLSCQYFRIVLHNNR